LKPLDANALQSVTLTVEKMLPHAEYYDNADERMQMLNFATENMYSHHIARLVSWHRHYTRYYKRAMIFCDFKWPDMVNTTQADNRGSTVEIEPKFIKAVTGQEISFIDGMRIGRKIWNLNNAIWTLQGRHRDMVRFADYLYDETCTDVFKWTTYNPDAMMAGRRWAYRDVGGRRLDRQGFENFKTEYYTIEGWDPDSGWCTREILEELDLTHVADKLAEKGKLP
jgi:aldehyde:ferredoxin oxidoreductase